MSYIYLFYLYRFFCRGTCQSKGYVDLKKNFCFSFFSTVNWKYLIVHCKKIEIIEELNLFYYLCLLKLILSSHSVILDMLFMDKPF